MEKPKLKVECIGCIKIKLLEENDKDFFYTKLLDKILTLQAQEQQEKMD